MRGLIRRCLEEDGGFDGDLTTKSIIPEEVTATFHIHVRNDGVLAGLDSLVAVIDEFGDISATCMSKDGDVVKCQSVAVVKGNLRAILLAERTILNILGYASGIATQTKRFVDAVSGTDCKICDTRKTTPGLRMLDKYAVVCGGGTSHRMGLHDAVLYKDNHLVGMNALSRELGAAISCIKEHGELKFIEVEVDSIAQFEEVLTLPVDIVLLDNMSTEELVRAVALKDASNTSVLLEASGGVNVETVRAIAETGVDRVSIGGLVHQATWLDFGLDAIDD